MNLQLPFTKMHGAGNDFVVLDGIETTLPALDDLARRLLDRHTGVGGDQLLVARYGRRAPFAMDIYNRDGSRSEMCGNGIRAFYKWLRDRHYTESEEIEIEVGGGVVRPRWMGPDRVRVDMGPPILAPSRVPTALRGTEPGAPALAVPLQIGATALQVSAISMGNPHAILYVDDVERAPVGELGPQIERHAAFPRGTNVAFVAIESPRRLRQRTWERGVGETLACGSAACAASVASVLRGVAERRVEVELPGGVLEIEWPHAGANVIMTGPAVEVFTGQIAV